MAFSHSEKAAACSEDTTEKGERVAGYKRGKKTNPSLLSCSRPKWLSFSLRGQGQALFQPSPWVSEENRKGHRSKLLELRDVGWPVGHKDAGRRAICCSVPPALRP